MYVGIDLGTTYSSVAYFDETLQKPVIVKSKYENAGTPSVLCFESENNVLYGDDAKELQEFGDENTIAFYKREMGNEDFRPEFWGKSYSAEDLSSIFLQKLIAEASGRLGQKITEAVITVPAYFNDYQRKATERAGERAGIKVLMTLNEPTAAAIAFGLNNLSGNRTYMVYDLGGGTFDVTIVNLSSQGIKVLGTDGNHLLGGKNWDDALALHIADQFRSEYGFDILEEAEAFYDLLVKCENAKKELSTKSQTTISVAANGDKGRYTITVDDFNMITENLMEQTRQLCEGLLEECQLSWQDLEGVLLVGGSTRMQMVQSFVREMSGKDAIHGVNVDEAVALGAAIKAHIEANSKISGFTIGGAKTGMPTLGAANIVDVTAHALGILQIKSDRSCFINKIVIPKNSSIPCSYTEPIQLNARNCRDGMAEVYVLQGSSEYPLDTTVLEKRVVTGINFKGLKDAIVDVTYIYDKNGTVHVEAMQRETKKNLSVHSEKLPDDISWMGGSPDEMRGEVQPVTVMLCLDTSGSMSGSMDAVKKAAMNLLDTLSQLDQVYVGLIEFESSVHVRLKPTDDLRTVAKEVNKITANGGTMQPMTEAYNILKKFNTQRYIVVLTDGSWEGQMTAKGVAKECRNKGIDIVAIGIGSGVDQAFLKSITTVDGIDVLTDINSLVSAFGNIGQEIASRSSGLSTKGFF